jgi:hypothetical protein
MRHVVRATSAVLLVGTSALWAQTRPQPVSPQDVEKLRRQLTQDLRSHVELTLDAHGENGGLNERLTYWRPGVTVNLLRADPTTTLHGGVQIGRYSSGESVLQCWGTRVSAGYKRKRSDGGGFQLEAGFTHFDTGASTVDGLASYTVRPVEASRLTVAAARSNVEESFLSLAGVTPVVGPFAGQRVGAVMDNRVALGGDYRLPYRLDVYAEGTLGAREGENVPSNPFKRASTGLGWSVIAREEESSPSLVRLSVALDYFGYDDDRFGYGGASLVDATFQPIPLEALGSDGISPEVAEDHAGVGGYFSPERFVSLTLRAEARGRSGSLDYRLGGFIGRQSYTGVDPRLAAGVNAQGTFHVGDSVSVPVTVFWDNYGPFHQYALQARVLVRF